MKIRVHGEMSLAEIRQALWEELSKAECEHGVRYSAGATLFINPTNGFGDRVIPRRQDGKRITDLLSTGPYRSAAEEFKL